MALELREEHVGASTRRCRPVGPPFAHALHARKANHELTGSGVFKPYVHAVEGASVTTHRALGSVINLVFQVTKKSATSGASGGHSSRVIMPSILLGNEKYFARCEHSFTSAANTALLSQTLCVHFSGATQYFQKVPGRLY